MIVSIVQYDIVWENPHKNRLFLEESLSKSIRSTHLIVLPEMLSTGFSMNCRPYAEPHEGETLEWMKTIAKTHQAAVTGSVMVQENGQYYNRLYFVYPNGEFMFYNKRHLFRMAEEDQNYTPGYDRIIIDYLGWKICPLICYDLRFPVFSRNQYHANAGFSYDLLIYVANWPEARRSAWINLLQARAHENLCYVAGVNRVGTDGNGKNYSGDSEVYNFKGEALIQHQGASVFIKTITLDKFALKDYRSKFNSLLDADDFTLIH